jgi:hypothetical protein
MILRASNIYIPSVFFPPSRFFYLACMYISYLSIPCHLSFLEIFTSGMAFVFYSDLKNYLYLHIPVSFIDRFIQTYWILPQDIGVNQTKPMPDPRPNHRRGTLSTFP